MLNQKSLSTYSNIVKTYSKIKKREYLVDALLSFTGTDLWYYVADINYIWLQFQSGWQVIFCILKPLKSAEIMFLALIAGKEKILKGRNLTLAQKHWWLWYWMKPKLTDALFERNFLPSPSELHLSPSFFQSFCWRWYQYGFRSLEPAWPSHLDFLL